MENCKRSFAKPANLNVHIKSEHDKHRFKCGICEQSFTAKCSLQRHQTKQHPHGNGQSQLPSSNDLNEFKVNATLESRDDSMLPKLVRLVRQQKKINSEIKELKKEKDNLLITYNKLLEDNQKK